MDWSFVNKTWEKWASVNVGSSGEPLKAALLINYDPTAPSRLLSIIAEQEGIKANPIELSQFVDFVKQNKLQTQELRHWAKPMYDGSIGSASCAMASVDQLAWQLSRRNL